MKRLLYVLLVLLLGVGVYTGRQLLQPPTAAADASLVALPVDDRRAGFAQALEPDAVEFPRDLGAHDDYQTEWWYYTGNLQTADGREFGYQLTFFRRALTAEAPAGDSSWRSNQVYLAHFTVSDIAAGDFYPTERFSRGAAGLAGAQAEPYRVWLENWYVEATAPGVVRLFATTDAVTLDLTLTQTLPPLLHGDGGLSAKGNEPGNASYYYSIVQQATAGTVTVDGEAFAVSGLSWKDHEYSTTALDPAAIGWDWFSLQFDNGGALMFFHIRREDGSLVPASSGSYITPDGQVETLTPDQWQVEVLDTWRSPASGATYPAAWRITIPHLDLELEGAALMPNQELQVSTVYWEGAVAFTGSLAGAPLTARGYIEMTGYAGSMRGII